MNSDSKFTEYEHKYVIDPDHFDIAGFQARVLQLKPLRVNRIQVEDTYYYDKKTPAFIIRHRFDQEIQQLTLKSLAKDSEARLEINLELNQERGNQKSAVQAILDTLGYRNSAMLHKDVHVYYFQDCELVYYLANTKLKSVHCIEIEAVGANDKTEALRAITYYENALGLDPAKREKRSLFTLLIETEFVPRS